MTRTFIALLAAASLAGADAPEQVASVDEVFAAVRGAERLRRSGDPAGALAALERRVAACRAAGDARCDRLLLVGVGEHHVATDAPAKGQDECEQARRASVAAADAHGEAMALSCLGAADVLVGTFAEAERAAARAVELARAVADRPLQAWATARCVAALRLAGDSSAARALLRERDALSGDDAADAELMRHEAGLAYESGPTAPDRFEAVLLAFRRAGDLVGEAQALNNAGFVRTGGSDRRASLDAFAEALRLFRAVGSVSGEAQALKNMGIVRSAVGEKRAALDLFRRALELQAALGDRASEAVTLNNLGSVHADLGERDEALALYRRALPLQRAAGDRLGEAMTLNNLATVHAGRGERQKALELLQESLALKRTTGDRAGEARTLANMGTLHGELGEHAKAIALLEQALALQRAVADRAGEARTLDNLAVVHLDRGEPGKALERCREALAIAVARRDRAAQAAALNQMGIGHGQLGERERALEAFQEAIALERAVGDRALEARTVASVASVHRDLGHREEALDLYGQALVLQRAVGDRAGEALVLWNVARLTARESPQRAILHAKQAVNVYQSLRRDLHGLDRETQRSYTRTVADAYRTLADLLAAQQRLGEAERVLGLLKDHEFFEFVRRDASTATGEPVALRAPEEAAARRYDALAAEITRLGGEYGELQRKASRSPAEEARFAALDERMTQAGAQFRAFLRGLDADLAPAAGRRRDYDDETSGLAGALADMEPGTVAVLTIAGERSLRTIVVTREVRTAHETPLPAAELARKIVALREALQDPGRDPRPLAAELYDLVVKPMEADLAGAGARTIVWSLDGALRYLPLAALRHGDRWLAEEYATVVVTSGDLATMQKRPSASWKALALGVTQQHDEFVALPGVRDEIAAVVGDGQAVRGALPGRGLLDAQFTETAFTDAVKYRPAVLHVASHFAFMPGDETKSFLLLGDGSHLTLAALQDRGRIFDGIDLLALSACNTAMAGEGSEVDGLARVAKKHGAGAVLATLWPVSDASTPALMRRFYELRETRKLTKAQALQQAQLELLRGAAGASGGGERGLTRAGVAPGFFPGWMHPYYWAPFVLLGNGR